MIIGDFRDGCPKLGKIATTYLLMALGVEIMLAFALRPTVSEINATEDSGE